MSTEHNFTYGSDQYNWIAKDLINVNRSITPWLIFNGHRPMYTSENYMDDYNVSLHMQSLFEDLLYENHVDIALWGHYHSYERTCAVYNQTCIADGIVHIITGAAGAELDRADWFVKSWSLNHTNAFFGLGRIQIQVTQQAFTQLKWQFILNNDDSVFDEMVLTKPLP